MNSNTTLSNYTISNTTTINGPISFFGAELSEQLTAPVNSGTPSTQGNYNMIVSLINKLSTYGFFSQTAPPEGRTVTFNNNSGVSLDLFLTVGAPNPSGPTFLQEITNGGSYEWEIPTEHGWNGNFTTQEHDADYVVGRTIFELGVNQSIPQNTFLRDTFDISTVPPTIPAPDCNNGPRDQCVAASYAPITSFGTGYVAATGLSTATSGSGTGLEVDLISVGGGGTLEYPRVIGQGGYIISDFGTGYQTGDTLSIIQGGATGGELTIQYSQAQAQNYNVGIEVIPPNETPTGAPFALPTVTVTCDTLDGNSSDSITYPNDTAVPKQQTGYAQGNYIVNFITPTIY